MALGKCRECGTEVSTSAKTCPKCGIKHPTTSSGIEALKTIPGLLVFGFILYYFFAPQAAPPRDKPTVDAARYSVQAVQTQKPTAPIGPDAQQRFVEIVKQAKDDYDAAGTDLQKGAARPARASKLCASIRSQTVTNWVGTISTLSSNSEGKGVLHVDIGGGIDLATWNNSISDISADTLIAPNSTLFNSLINMKKGDVVQFSGTLFKDQIDCFKETSLTLRGSIKEPEFLFKFSSISKM